LFIYARPKIQQVAMVTAQRVGSLYGTLVISKSSQR